MLRNSHEALGDQANVFDVGDVHERGHKGLELGDGHVGDIDAGDYDVAHGRRFAEVVEHLLVAVFLGKLKAKLDDLRDIVTHQIHARTVATVLRAGGKHFGKNFGRIAMREAFDGPHFGFVEAVAARFGMAGPVRVAIVEGWEHVTADGIVPEIFFVHGIKHLRRDEDGHGGALANVALHAFEQALREQRAEDRLDLFQIFYRVAALPESGFPFGGGDVLVARQAAPIRLDKFALQRIFERLLAGVDFAGGLPDGPGCLDVTHVFHDLWPHVLAPWDAKRPFLESAGKDSVSFKDTMKYRIRKQDGRADCAPAMGFIWS